MAFNLRGNSVPDGSITNAKLADDSVSTSKLQNNAVTLAKAVDALANESFFGSEATLSHGTTTETSVAEFNFIKGSGDQANWNKLAYQVKLQSSNASNTASFRVYIDSVAYGTGVSTTSTSATALSESSIDISALANGNHFVELKLNNTSVSESATLSQIDVFFSKK